MPTVEINEYLFAFMFFISILLDVGNRKPYLSGLKKKERERRNKVSCYKTREIETSKTTNFAKKLFH